MESYEEINKRRNIRIFETAAQYLTLARSQQTDARDYEAAKARYLEAAEVAEQLPKDDFDSQMLLAEIYEAVARLYDGCFHGDFKAHEYFDKALDIRKEWSEKKVGLADDPDYMDRLATLYFDNSELMFRGDYDIDYYGEETYYGFVNATCIWEGMLEDTPAVTEKLLHCYYTSSEFYVYCGISLKRVRFNYENALDITKKLNQDDSKNQDALATAYFKFAGYLQEVAEEFEQAKDYYCKAIAIREAMPKDNAVFLNALASACYALALLEEDSLSDCASAVTHYAKAAAYWEQMPQETTEHHADQSDACYRLSCLEERQPESFGSAKAHYGKAIELWEPLTGEHAYREKLEKMHYKFASLLQNRLDEHGPAIEQYQKAIELLLQLDRKDDAHLQHELAMSYNNIAYSQQNYLKLYDEAKENYQKAIAVSELLPKDSIPCMNGLAHEYYNIADLYEKHFHEYKTAIAYYSKAVEVEHWLSIVNPENHLVNVPAFNYSRAESLFLDGEQEAAFAILEAVRPLAKKCFELNPEDRYTRNVNASIANALQQYDRLETAETVPAENAAEYDYYISYRKDGYGKAAFHFKKILEKYGKKVFIAGHEASPANRQELLQAIENSRHYIVTAGDESLDGLADVDDYYSELLKIAGELESTDKSALIVELNQPNNQLVNYLLNAESIEYGHSKFYSFEEELCGKLGLAYDPDVQIAEDPDYLMAVAAAFKNLGQRSGNDEERRHYKHALDVAGRLPKDNPDCQEFLAWLCTYLGNVRYKPKDHYHRAIEIREQMPQTPENLHALAELYDSLAFIHSIDKEAEESALCKRKSAEYLSRLNEGENNE